MGLRRGPSRRPFRLLFPPEKITGGPAHSQGERNGCESIKNRPFVSGFGDKALEAGFVNLDLPHRSGEHAAVLNQKGFGGISANDNPRRQRQTCAIEDAIRNFHRSRLFDIKAIASTQLRSEEHTSELQSLMRISYAAFCFKKKQPYSLAIHIYKQSF